MPPSHQGSPTSPQAPFTSSSLSSGERVPRWGSLALSRSWVRRAGGRCWVVNGCWRTTVIRLLPVLQALSLSLKSPAHPLPPTCRSFSAVGLFLGFLVRASLRKWWKFWVLVGIKAPPTQTQVQLCKAASCPFPQPATKGAAVWSVLLLPQECLPHKPPAPPSLPSHCLQRKPRSILGKNLYPTGLGWLEKGISGLGEPSPTRLVSQLGWLEAAFRHEHQGPEEDVNSWVKGQYSRAKVR